MNIIITGGASGLGKSITERLIKNSSSRFLVSYRTSTSVVEQWKETYPQIQFAQCDFADKKSVASFLDTIENFSPDILINNAHAGYEEKYFHKTEGSSISDSFQNNVLATLQITAKCVSVFRKKKSGRIINILSSAVAGNPPIGWSVYTAEKNYLLSMSKSWAIENAAFKITSNCISPEFMQTNMTSVTDERIVEQMTSTHPLKKLLTTTEVAEAVDFFTTCPLHINGTNLIINSAKNVI